MFIRTPQPPPPGAPVDVSLEARGQALAFAHGVVAYSLPMDAAWHSGRLPGFGVRFVDLPDRSRKLVQHIFALRDTVDPPTRKPLRRPVPLLRRKRRSMRPVVVASACVLGLAGAVAVAPARTLEAVEQYFASLVNP
jgi:hypothetical protein